MALKLIVGPSNSGRAGAVRERLAAVADLDPLLVVPTVEDIDRFERELSEDAAMLGVTTLGFNALFDSVASATGARFAPPLSDAQRLSALRAAIPAAGHGALARSAERRGFAPALAELLDGCSAARLGSSELTANAAADGDRYLADVAAVAAGYEARLAELGRGDRHGLAGAAIEALRAEPGSWGGRPVFLYGFDDLSIEQLELLDALAGAADVTVTVTYEERPALAARRRLREELEQRGAEVELQTEPNPAYTDSALLFHLERNFCEPDPERLEADPADGLVVLEAAGARGQAEQVGAEISPLLAAGAEPGSIAVALRSLDRDGPLFEAVLDGLGIPVATDARAPLASTATGRALIALLEALFGSGAATDLLAFLRGPGVARPDDVDWLERELSRGRLQSADDAIEAWTGRALFEVDELRDAADAAQLLRRTAGFARRIAEYPDNRKAAIPGRHRRLELRAGAAAADALEALAELPWLEDGPAEAIAALRDLDLPLWEGPPGDRVLISSPSRLRAARFEHVFVATLQLDEFPRPAYEEALLSAPQREALGLPERRDPEEDDRYLFQVCLGLPTSSIYLCWQSTDEEGAAGIRSPFIDGVRELLSPAPPEDDSVDPVIEALTRRRPLATVSLAPVEETVLAERRKAADARAAYRPGPLASPAVVGELAGRKLFGASTLEGFRECSYRWFVDHELRPEPVEPEPEARAAGSVVHAVLEGLYKHPPAPGARPAPDTLDQWGHRAAELVEKEAGEKGLGGPDPTCVAARARCEAQVLGFLRRDAAAETPLAPEPELVEATFGDDEEDSRPPLEIGDFGLHGKIDRIDVATDAALLRDYKTSREVTKAADLVEEGKLQLQLYALAVERLWERRPAGAIYEPLGATKDHRPRGIARKDEATLLGGLDMVANDLLAAEDFERTIAEAEQLATEIVGRMRTGDIRRDPLGDECPKYCTYAPVCRRERARPELEEEEEEDAEG